MIYQGRAIEVEPLESGIARLCFDQPDSSVNVFNRQLLNELHDAIEAVAASQATGLLCVSAKNSFIVGADIKEFTRLFRQSGQELLEWSRQSNLIFNALEDLPIPTVSAVGGMALGGGLEMAMATDFRVASENASLGFPEVTLGICPGFGGTVRAPRLLGPEAAIDWISGGRPVKAQQALALGGVDAVVAPDMLEEAALEHLERAIAGEHDWRAVHRLKTEAMEDSGELRSQFETSLESVEKAAGPRYPAGPSAVRAMARSVTRPRGEALEIEHETFVELARSTVAANLIRIFLNDQFIKSKVRRYASEARDVQRAAVLGAGIMGGGIALQSALKGVPVHMKDIAEDGLDAGVAEARKQLGKRVEKGRMTQEQADGVLANIHPQLDYNGFDGVNLVMEAVVENVSVKLRVLSEVEQMIPEDTVLSSNTSTISITRLAESLRHPENFCGMHYFNPVPVMPLVEVIRGERSSDTAIATTVAYAQRIGKTPIVVNDCPGFLVNRILFPYFGAFCQLMRDGADFREIDKAMETFGWPMGPAYLLDVVGMDTAAHCQAVMAEGYPDRMRYDFDLVIDRLYEAGHYGQKNGTGFYRYDSSGGRPQKQYDPSIAEYLAPICGEAREFSEQEIVERMMTAMCLESVRCLEDGIVGSAIEADMSLLLGIGFPRFRGGALRWMDTIGLDEFCLMADKYADLGPLYHPTEKLRDMARRGETFYQD